jgi:hypothetical protein
MLFAIVAGAIAVLAADVAAAQPGGTKNPWCLVDGPLGRGSWDCAYYNQQQCLDSASGAGGWCTPNPWYEGPRTKRPRRQQRNY